MFLIYFFTIIINNKIDIYYKLRYNQGKIKVVYKLNKKKGTE